MINLNAEQIELFKQTFIEYQKKFQLDEYELFFQAKEIEDQFANINICHLGANFMLTLNTKLDDRGMLGTIEDSLKRIAKHEAIHLLLGKFSACAGDRYVTQDELTHFEETLVRKLEWLIQV